MKKYTVNYNRHVPQHRIPFDFHVYNQYKKLSLIDVARWHKNALFTMWTNQLPIYLCLAGLAIFGVFGTYLTWDMQTDVWALRNKSRPIFKYLMYTQDPSYNMGPYNNLLNKFKYERLGQKDLGWDE